MNSSTVIILIIGILVIIGVIWLFVYLFKNPIVGTANLNDKCVVSGGSQIQTCAPNLTCSTANNNICLLNNGQVCDTTSETIQCLSGNCNNGTCSPCTDNSQCFFYIRGICSTDGVCYSAPA